MNTIVSAKVGAMGEKRSVNLSQRKSGACG